MLHSTSRLLLRAPVAHDLQRLFAIYGDPATQRYNPAGPLGDISQAQALLDHWLHHWQQHGYGPWAIARRARPDEVLGFGGISWHDYLGIKRLNLGYRLAVEAWGQGYATELAQAALELGFKELALPHLFALVRPEHQASIRVLEKAGLRRIDLLDDVPGQAPSLVYRIDRPAQARP